nr:SurA N-terminal domain-containing protein [Candidatus Saccharibacteria bacterium]
MINITKKDPSNKSGEVISGAVKCANVKNVMLKIKNNKLITVLILIIVIAVCVGFYFLFIKERPVLTVNGVKIYKSDIAKDANLNKKAWRASNKNLSEKEVYEKAKNHLKEKAFISQGSKKKNITVSDKELNEEYRKRVAEYGRETDFLTMLRETYGWTKEQYLENLKLELIKEKLVTEVVASYSGEVLFVRYDVYGNDQQGVEQALAKANELRQQMISGKKPEDIVDSFENSTLWHRPFIDSYKFTGLNGSNDKEYFEGREDWQNISKLTTPGQVTPVYKSAGGYFGVAVLTARNGGAHNSWDAYTSSFKVSMGERKAIYQYTRTYASLFKLVINHVQEGVKFIYTEFTGKVAYAICEHPALNKSGSCCKLKNPGSQIHIGKLEVIVTDSVTGDKIPGATVRVWFNGQNYHNLCNSEIDNRVFRQETNRNGIARFELSCWVHYTISVSHADYGYAIVDENWKPKNGATDTINFRFHKWTLRASSDVDRRNVQVGDPPVVFTHDIWNASNKSGMRPGAPGTDVKDTFKSTVIWESGSGEVYWVSNPNSGGATPTMPSTRTHGPLGAGKRIEPKRVNRFTPSSPGVYCQSIIVKPSVSNDDKSSFTSGRACVEVGLRTPPDGGFTPHVDVTDYEKGNNTFSVTHRVAADRSACPSAGNNLTRTWSYGGGLLREGTQTVTYNCSAPNAVPTITGGDTVVTLYADSTQRNTLDAQDPGTSYSRFTTIGTSTETKNFTVYEVPYTRFYGHDVHATNGDVIFNTNPIPPNSQGIASASQYAIIARSTIAMASAAFHHNATNPPRAPYGLSVGDYAFGEGERALEGKLPTTAIDYSRGAGGSLPTPPVDASGGYYKV